MVILNLNKVKAFQEIYSIRKKVVLGDKILKRNSIILIALRARCHLNMTKI